jgi:parvulin-like peptidyl-prolyl isomerase
LLDYDFRNINSGDVSGLFGQEFATQLAGLPAKTWQGPVTSAYGAHLVFIEQRTSGRVPTLEEVRTAVRQAWINTRRIETNEQFYQSLLKRYTVTIEQTPPADGEKKLAGAK